MSREALQQDVEDFLRAGGKIKQLAPADHNQGKPAHRELTSRTRYVRQRALSHYKMHGTLELLAEYSSVPASAIQSLMDGGRMRDVYVTLLERAFDRIDNMIT